MTRATLTGPRIKATSCLTGNDWFQSLGDGYGRPHVRIPFRTDDGALLPAEDVVARERPGGVTS